MTILAIDDEPVMLAHLETELRKVFPKADIVTFDECDEVLAFLETPQSRSLHYAFMDIKLRACWASSWPNASKTNARRRHFVLHLLLLLRAGSLPAARPWLPDEARRRR